MEFTVKSKKDGINNAVISGKNLKEALMETMVLDGPVRLSDTDWEIKDIDGEVVVANGVNLLD